MFWPGVIAAPLWHSCSLDHLKPNEMWWGGIKGQSPPSLSSLPPYHSSLHPPIPSSPDNPELGRKEQVSPWRISFLDPSPSLTQESSQCQYHLVNISFSISRLALFHRITTSHLSCFSLLRPFKLCLSQIPSFFLFLLMENKLFFLSTEFCCIGLHSCHLLLCAHQFRFGVPETQVNQTVGWGGYVLVLSC